MKKATPQNMTTAAAKKMEQETKQIATRAFGVETLEVRGLDSLDFHSVAIWEIKHAIEAAYFAGMQAAQAGKK